MPSQIPLDVPLHTAAEYTQAVRNLTDEIACGMRAIAANQIVELRESLTRQQQLGAALHAMAVQGWIRDQRADDRSAVDAAHKELLDITRAYEELIARGRRSALLLEGLCVSYTGQYSTDSRPLRGRLNLSCEA